MIDHATGRIAITAQNHGFAVQGEAGQRFDTRSDRRSSVTPAPTTASSKASNWPAGARFRCSTTRRRQPVRTTRNTCSTSSST
ncbi:carbamoyl-phosphate synthase small chain domain protein [Mycobacterium xenopi 4042]|uniref:Carbamoyl-phosphate synthase small chain domain protein n=1 Tax=Mycobacterium xenopi 4042 TaxID=1299334 RepID=X7ZLH3_MYCXE|nr:carbamoyl-phosphate synthase small chain domain protein [Mycobacterium xenopi 4042]